MGDPAYEVKTVDRLIAVINAGDDGEEATRLYRHAMETIANYIQEHGGKHKAVLTLKISMEGDPKGVDVSIDVACTLPKRPKQKERFFMTPENALTLQDPMRETMFPGIDAGRARRAAAAE